MRVGLHEFYDNTNVLVTGGTGFIGKVLIEKLLRSQNNIRRVYILVRNKRDKLVDNRVRDDIFGQPIFDHLKKYHPNFMEKVRIIEGDITQPRLGLKEDDIDLLLREINIVLNVAASTNMGATLKYNTNYNIRSVIELLNLCREMKNLKSVVIVSTAYANCNKQVIEEKIYKSAIKPQLALKMCEEIDDDMLVNMTEFMLNGLPNSYTLTKCIMENSLLDYEDLPIVVFRPSIVTSAFKEPLPGWIDNFNGIISYCFLIGMGICKTADMNADLKSSWVPVDLCTNALICSAWHGTQNRLSKNHQPIIYNYASNDYQQPIRRYIDLLIGTNVKLEGAIWYPLLIHTEIECLRPIMAFILNILPAMVMDVFLVLSGNKFRLMRLFKDKINPAFKVLTYFANHEWTFKEDNVHNMLDSLNEEEKSIYPFDMGKLDWKEYAFNMAVGIKVYLGKEKIEDNHRALRKHNRLRLVHYTFLVIFWSLLFWLLYKLITFTSI